MGLLLELPLAMGLARSVSSLAYDTPRWDLALWLGLSPTLSLVVGASAWWPALRASRLDPADVLRSEWVRLRGP